MPRDGIIGDSSDLSEEEDQKLMDYSAPDSLKEFYPPPHPNIAKIRVPDEDCARMSRLLEHFKEEEYKGAFYEELKQSNFSNWEHTEFDLMLFLRHMFYDMGFVQEFQIDATRLNNFLLEVYRHYNRNPFHNFQHAFMTAQMVYVLILNNNLREFFPSIELFAMFLASICHDMDHPGLTNHYQTISCTTLFIASMGQSPLEHHHWEVTQKVLNHPRCNLLYEMAPKDGARVKATIERLIMATDMGRHKRIMGVMDNISRSFDKSADHLELLQTSLMKIADLNSTVRPLCCGDRWVECLYEEFFAEAWLLLEAGKEVPAHIDPRKVLKSEYQLFFLEHFTKKMVQTLANILPSVSEMYMDPINAQMKLYSSEARRFFDMEMREKMRQKFELSQRRANGNIDDREAEWLEAPVCACMQRRITGG